MSLSIRMFCFTSPTSSSSLFLICVLVTIMMTFIPIYVSVCYRFCWHMQFNCSRSREWTEQDVNWLLLLFVTGGKSATITKRPNLLGITHRRCQVDSMTFIRCVSILIYHAWCHSWHSFSVTYQCATDGCISIWCCVRVSYVCMCRAEWNVE